MKLLITLFLFLSICCTNPYLHNSLAMADRTYYARIMNNQTCIYYSTADLTNPMFLLPETYFVELISETEDGFYYARYNDIYGYVKKEQVKPINETPQAPFLTNISFRVFVPSGANLRSSPYNLGVTNLVYSIPFLETNLLYYGISTGEEAISKKGNIWYYCKYFLNNLSYTGYLYSPLCDCLSEIMPNNEEFEYIEGPLVFKEISEIISTNELESLSPTMQTIIIVAISLPCLLFIYLLFKPSKIAESNSEKAKNSKSHRKKPNKISRLKHSDYFEFDDDF